MITAELELARSLRNSYRAVKAAIPWLDASVWPDDPPAFSSCDNSVETPFVRTGIAELAISGQIRRLRSEGRIAMLRYSPERSGGFDSLRGLFREMADAGMGLTVLHTDVGWQEIDDLAGSLPDLSVIVESGPARKILYDFDTIERLMQLHANLYLCTFNLCNWLGLDRLCARGLGNRLLYGSHSPRFNPNAATGMIILSSLTWTQKCDIAGNNLRRLLGQEVQQRPEVQFQPGRPFIIDSHAHCIRQGEASPLDFYTPDVDFSPADWEKRLDELAIEQILLIPMEALFDAGETSRDLTAPFRACAPDRFGYLEVFHPNAGKRHLARVEASLREPWRPGIKIHPSLHRVEADDDAYIPAFELAAQYNAAILTHSWDVSEHNPNQYMSHPARFRRHLQRYPNIRFVLGHAGGRPGAFDATVRLCHEFPGVRVDIAGDYFDNGLIECLVANLGAGRVLFGTDVDWIDPRAVLGPLLDAKISDQDLLQILRTNAQATFER